MNAFGDALDKPHMCGVGGDAFGDALRCPSQCDHVMISDDAWIE